MDFADLKDDKAIQEKVQNFCSSVGKIEQKLDAILAKTIYDSLNTYDKVNFDLFLGFTLNTLYWLYLRTKGIDPNQNDVKQELSRIRDYMLKAKEAHERNTIRPTVNQAVAERIIMHGIQHKRPRNEEDQPKPKRRRARNE